MLKHIKLNDLSHKDSHESSFYLQLDLYNQFHYATAGGNCKLCYISDIAGPLDCDINTTIVAIKKVLEVTKKLCFQVNVNDLSTVNKLNKYFPIIFCNKTPIGYGGGYTYMALFLVHKHNESHTPLSRKHILGRLNDEKYIIESFKYKCIYKDEVVLKKVPVIEDITKIC